MTTSDVETNTDAQSADAVGVESPSPTGIMKATDPKYYDVPASEVLEETASAAARRLQEFVLQKKNKHTLKNDMRQTCEFVLKMVLGKNPANPV